MTSSQRPTWSQVMNSRRCRRATSSALQPTRRDGSAAFIPRKTVWSMYSRENSADMGLDLQPELPDRRAHALGLAGQGHPHEGAALAVIAPEEVGARQDVDVAGQEGLLQLPGVDA